MANIFKKTLWILHTCEEKLSLIANQSKNTYGLVHVAASDQHKMLNYLSRT